MFIGSRVGCSAHFPALTETVMSFQPPFLCSDYDNITLFLVAYDIITLCLVAYDNITLCFVAYFRQCLSEFFSCSFQSYRILTEFQQSYKLTMYRSLAYTIAIFVGLFAVVTIVILLGKDSPLV